MSKFDFRHSHTHIRTWLIQTYSFADPRKTHRMHCIDCIDCIAENYVNLFNLSTANCGMTYLTCLTVWHCLPASRIVSKRLSIRCPHFILRASRISIVSSCLACRFDAMLVCRVNLGSVGLHCRKHRQCEPFKQLDGQSYKNLEPLGS